MKKNISLSVFAAIITISLMAQSPQSFKYQAVIRDAAGNIIADQLVAFRLSILQTSETGATVYSEIQSGTTNAFGLIIFNVGAGSVESGIFENINWSRDDHFLKIEIDVTGGTDYQFMGTSQLLLVPYSFHSKTSGKFPDLTSEERDTMTIIQEGACYYNTTTKMLTYHDGTGWFEIQGTCAPQPTPANAGADQPEACTETTLAGNAPQYGTGFWEILSGLGGNIAEPNNHSTQFTGVAGNSYQLKWTISNTCGSSEDEVNISIIPAQVANAGPDQIGVPSPTSLAGNTPVAGSGLWTIMSGVGGVIAEPSNPESTFSGLAYNSYTLRWTITTGCGSVSDDVNITFTTSAFDCGTTLTDYRDGKTYPTVLIGTQCWMAKNINIGTRIEGVNNASNNGIIEKYCTGNLESNCNVYGGLYQWSEMMQYTTTPGTQGICTPGWHLPTDNELKTLEGTVDSQYGVGNPVWDLTGDRGLDAGGNLKETGVSHWAFPNNGATNSSGFTALPGGARNTDGTYPGLTIYGRFWTSTESGSTAYRRVLS
ncbi:MAG: hypothetical protein FJY07_03790, partial [Bacteroidetes bacterium]|nr:hypothetical protein [Bacteroidota bacterium]